MVDGVAVRQWGDPSEPAILLWPGLGSAGAYFSAVAGLLPGRAVAVDPPGFGLSPPVEPCSFERLVEVASRLIETCGCRAIVGHSLGADVALGVANAPPTGLRAVVLVDGGYLDAATRAELGLPAHADRTELATWWEANAPRFPDWETAIRELATLFAADVSPAVEAAVRDSFTSIEGEIRGMAPPERVADLLLAILHQDVLARARSVAVATLLVACGQPAERADVKRRAWQAFADASPLVELHVADAWGHNPLLQDPGGSAQLIGDWLRARWSEGVPA